LRRVRAPLAILGFVAVSAALVVTSACDDRITNEQTDPCKQMLGCYFGNPGLKEQADFQALGFDDNAEVIQRAYGADGDCWKQGDDVANACDARCRRMLYLDCVEGLAGGEPFCSSVDVCAAPRPACDPDPVSAAGVCPAGAFCAADDDNPSVSCCEVDEGAAPVDCDKPYTTPG
jgi:hypothetical protein